MKEPNTQECELFGRKLSSASLDDIAISAGWSICIGSDKDDEIYFHPVLKQGEAMLKERVKVYLESDNGEGCELDLEDLLNASAKHCRKIYERVLNEND
ncbi:MAG: hypothetical protein KAU21_14370 [Gammaproteobacteria bacterium]|nr:hypothetical protein [Gammaproteobacteria bacterium]